jgi:putative peptidoglycan lipid II flippase
VYYQILAGSLFASVLVPVLVPHIDRGNDRRAKELVSGFLGTLLLVAVAASGILLLAGQLILRLITIGVADPATATAQSRVGWALLVMFTPQIALYLVAGTGTAVMNAKGRFALAAGAPALENVGIIIVMAVTAIAFGAGTSILHISTGHLLILGIGTTAAVAVHASCQWLGARSSGLAMTVSRGWRDPEVRIVLGRLVPTLAYTGLAASQVFALLVLANRVAGGVVAFQLALNFFYLPLAVVAWPVARAILPQLARLRGSDDRQLFAAEFSHGIALASFVVVPISIAYVTLSFPLARAVAFGKLGTGHGVRLLALSLATLGVGVLAETWFILGTYAFYAREDVRSPLQSMAVRVGVSLCLMLATWRVHGDAILPLLGLSVAGGSVAGAWYMARKLSAALPNAGAPLLGSLARTLGASVVMAVPAFLTAAAIGHVLPSKAGAVAAMVAAGMVGLVVFGGIQFLLRSPELVWIKAALARVPMRRPAPAGGSA